MSTANIYSNFDRSGQRAHLQKSWARLRVHVCSDLCGYACMIHVSMCIYMHPLHTCIYYKYVYVFEHIQIHDHVYALKIKIIKSFVLKIYTQGPHKWSAHL